MAESKISYIKKNYDDYKQSIIDITKKYYPDVFDDLDDASIGAWLIDILSDIGDNLQFHIDRSVQETYIESASEFTSLLDIARTNGLRVPYKKAAVVEVELSCSIPLYTQGTEGNGDLAPDEKYCPYVKRGTKFSSGITTFELVNDVDFKEQFDENGNSNRQIIPKRDSNGNIISYTYKKLAIASASQTKVFKMVLTPDEIKPFMEIEIPDSNVLGIESIIVKDGTNINTDPQISEFYVDKEVYHEKRSDKIVKRFFEVENLIDQYRFGYVIDDSTNGYYNPVWEIAESIMIDVDSYSNITKKNDNGCPDTINIIEYDALGKYTQDDYLPYKYKNNNSTNIIDADEYDELPDRDSYTVYQYKHKTIENSIISKSVYDKLGTCSQSDYNLNGNVYKLNLNDTFINYFDEDENTENIPETYTVPVKRVVKGKWKRLKHKFITEYTDDWKLKVTFGPGIEGQNGQIPDNANEFTQYQMSRMMANDYMGVLPEANKTMYILYRTGGGEISNIAANTLTNIIGLSVEIAGNCDDASNGRKIRDVNNSISVTNTTPSYGGKDAPTEEEIRYMIKYNSGSQNRCVTLKDYYARIGQIPAKYGCPFRYGVVEENNKVVIYTLGLDYLGHLSNKLSEYVAENIKEYLSMYRSMNDFIEIKSGKIINLKFRVTVFVDKTYDKSEVAKRVIDLVYDYMDVRKHLLGEDIFVGDLQKEISKLDGVLNLINLRVFNKHGDGYSYDVTTQETVDPLSCGADTMYDEEQDVGSSDANDEIDLRRGDYTLFSEANSMFEIKYKEKDIVVVIKTRT